MAGVAMNVPVSQVSVPTWRNHYADAHFEYGLTKSILKWGQLRPVIVREVGKDLFEVIDGQALLICLALCGIPFVEVRNMGVMTDSEARLLSMAMLSAGTVDYASVGPACAALAQEFGAKECAEVTPFSEQRLAHFETLRTFDWSQFVRKATAQDVMMFDDDETDGVEEALEG